MAGISNTIQKIQPPTPDQWAEVLPHYQVHATPGSAASEIPAPVSINVLEFATAVFAVVVAAPMLRGQVVDIGTDNTAALCWLVRHRSSAGAADALLKLLALTCVLYSIRIIAHHVRGIVNYIPDWISRVLGAEFADPPKLFRSIRKLKPIAHEHFIQSLHDWVASGETLSRREIGRLLLSHILQDPTTMSADTVVQMMFLVLATENISPITDGRIPRVMTSFQRLIDEDIPNEGIPPTLSEALAAAKHWDTLSTTTTPNTMDVTQSLPS
jgi:hypothetical protein